METALQKSVPEFVLHTKDAEKQTKELPLPASCKLHPVDEKTLKEVAVTVNPEGILAVFPRPEYCCAADFQSGTGLHLALDGWKDPSNVGAAIRSARGLGARSVFLLPDCPDAFSPKVIRVSMGSVFHLPIGIGELEDFGGWNLLAADMFGETASAEALDKNRNNLVIVGCESGGLSDAVRSRSRRIGIPMTAELDSFSAPLAASLILDRLNPDRSFC